MDVDIVASVRKLKELITETSGDFESWIIGGNNPIDDPSWKFEICFLQLMAVLEALHFEEYRKFVWAEYKKLKRSKSGFTEVGQTDWDEPYSITASTLRTFVRALEPLFPDLQLTVISKDLIDIIRDANYVITDDTLFSFPPQCEDHIHTRIEGILKCVFPDLKRKPSLTKAIKNFIPDTGIPSLETLLEYKYLDDKDQVGPIADEILADTRGYVSKEWSRFIYVIYETERFRNEKEWNQLLRQSGLSNNTRVVVLYGVLTNTTKNKPVKITPTKKKAIRITK